MAAIICCIGRIYRLNPLAFVLAFGNFLDQLTIECGQIIRLAACHKSTVYHDFLVYPIGPRILQVSLDRRIRSHLASVDYTSFHQHPGAMTNRADWFSLVKEAADKLYCLLVSA